jgi:hypothetical protein
MRIPLHEKAAPSSQKFGTEKSSNIRNPPKKYLARDMLRSNLGYLAETEI